MSFTLAVARRDNRTIFLILTLEIPLLKLPDNTIKFNQRTRKGIGQCQDVQLSLPGFMFIVF